VRIIEKYREVSRSIEKYRELTLENWITNINWS